MAFYTTQARQRLEDNPRAQKIVRLALGKLWKPVGSGMMDDAIETSSAVLVTILASDMKGTSPSLVDEPDEFVSSALALSDSPSEPISDLSSSSSLNIPVFP